MESEELIDDEQIEHIRRILDHKIETDQDYADLAELVDADEE